MYKRFEQVSRVVPLEGGVNFLDLGGYGTEDGRQVKRRKIFRCGHLGDLTARDLDALEYLRVTEVHDFRRKEEQEKTPSQPIRATFNDDYEMFIGSMSKFWEFIREEKLNSESAHNLVVTSYRNCADEVAPHYRRLFQSLLSNAENSTLFHCSAGKDRTGIAAALIHSALGVSRDEVIADYMLTLEHFNIDHLVNIIESRLREAKVESWQRAWLMPYCSVHQDNIEAFFDGIDSNYGSLQAYLQQAIGLTPENISALKQAYLEG